MNDQLYPLAQVLMTLELTEATVTSWAKRGVKGVKLPPSGRGHGRSRVLSTIEIYRLAFIKTLTARGVMVGIAGRFADELVDALQFDSKIKSMTIYDTAGIASASFNDGPCVLPTLPNSAITLYARNIMRTVDQALATPVRPGTEFVVEPARQRRSRKTTAPKP